MKKNFFKDPFYCLFWAGAVILTLAMIYQTVKITVLSLSAANAEEYFAMRDNRNECICLAFLGILFFNLYVKFVKPFWYKKDN